VWYDLLKTALRKHNLRVDLRVYLGDEIKQSTVSEAESKIKSILSSSIIKGLDIIGVVSRFGVEPGIMAANQARQNNIDVKVIPGQDYYSADKVKAVFFNIKQNIPPGLPIKEAIIQAKNQNGKVLLYDLSRRAVRAIADWKSTSYEPDFVEIYNAKSKGYHDVDVDYPRVISSAAKSGAELEKIPVYTEMSRKQLVDFGFLQDNEGEEFTPGYLLPKKGEENYG
jgi:hypothetical protein